MSINKFSKPSQLDTLLLAKYGIAQPLPRKARGPGVMTVIPPVDKADLHEFACFMTGLEPVCLHPRFAKLYPRLLERSSAKAARALR
jgi:hypothetical protein